MKKLKINKKSLEKFVRRVFPNSSIDSFDRFSNGFVSPTFKLKINNPSRIIVVKIGKLKKREIFHKNNLILNFLNGNKIPSPEVFYENSFGKKYITIMDYSSGEVASDVFKKAGLLLRKKILFNMGKNLKTIHNLNIPDFWVHHSHEVRNIDEWKNWTKLRIEKYLSFIRLKFDKYYIFLKSELNDFLEIVEKENIDFVPLHWDYHLANVNVNTKGEVVGNFDFDNAMKGHSLADLGLTLYWIWFEMDDNKNFESFLKGYKSYFSNNELRIIRGYFILHLLAVTRSIWFKKRLRWIIDKHMNILEEMIKNTDLLLGEKNEKYLEV
jgi:Ser/Thr protein kinase RdoA (MazF antagonist)